MLRFKLKLALFLVAVQSVLTDHDEQNSKRLLLNDPDIITQRMNNMEKQMAQLQADLLVEKTKNTNLEKQLSVLQTKNADIDKKNINFESQISVLQTKNADVEKEVTQIKTEFADERIKYDTLRKIVDGITTPGSTYVRWGRKTCTGQHTEQIYTGFAAGQNYYDPDYSTRFGGAANLLCLPNNPEIGNKSAPGGSYLYGTEYEQSFFGTNAIDEDVPCALCRSVNTFSSVMIPGRKSCYDGWKIEYYGVLASDSYADKASSFICIDGSPEYLQGGKDNKNGNLLYGTGTKCGSLPCPPYTENVSVNCVVCSK